MKPILIHFANLVVMAHMMFGCSLHHGLGSVHACEHQESAFSCLAVDHDGNHPGHDHSHHEEGDHEEGDHDSEFPDSESSVGLNCASHGHSHIGCQDDGCHVQQLSEFAFNPWDFVTIAFGDRNHFVTCHPSVCPAFSGNDGTKDRISAPKVRSHLLVCVQLI